jgi:hypothetical protein
MLVEALDSVLAPEVRDSVLARALQRAKRPGLPGKLESLLQFARNELSVELVTAAGAEARDCVLASLEQVIANAVKVAEARRTPAPAIDPTTPAFGNLRETVPEGLVLPRVIVATRDLQLLRALTRGLGRGALVEGAIDLIDLVDSLQTGAEVVLVIVDARPGGVGGGGLVTMAPDLPADLVIVVWAATEGMRAMLDAEPRTKEWIHVPATRAAEDLARTCFILLGGF